MLEARWTDTIDRARHLPADRLTATVDGEWSFLQTLRHLVFATDSWVRRALLGDPAPWDPLDLPWDEAPGWDDIPWDRDARPSLDEVLAVRCDRQATVRRVLDERASHTAPRSRFFDELEDYMAEDAAEQTLRTIVSWGRYAEAFAYDDHSGMFSLENPVG